MNGIWLLIFLGRWSMVLGWIDLVKRRVMYRHEFVSADARRLSNDPRTYEMLSSHSTNLKSPDAVVMSPPTLRSPAFSPISPDVVSKTDYFARDAKPYLGHTQSFSTPRPPSSGRHNNWDSRATHARGLMFPGAELSKNFAI